MSKNNPTSPAKSGLDRRQLMGLLATGALASACSGGSRAATGGGTGSSPTLVDPVQREMDALGARDAASALARSRGIALQTQNGDEAALSGRLASMTKGLPHDANGIVDPTAWNALINGLTQATQGSLDAIPMGGARRLPSPLSGLSFVLEGSDPTTFSIPAAPAFDSRELASEMVELHWMAELRDLPFDSYAGSQLAADAAAELNGLGAFTGPRNGAGAVDTNTLFRGETPASLIGPYISQWLLRSPRFGPLEIPMSFRPMSPNQDFVTDRATWLANLRGASPAAPARFESTARFPITLRDLATYVQVDELYQAYELAAVRMLDESIPFTASFDAYRLSPSCEGAVTFGGPHALGLVVEVAQRALCNVWYSKWFVHRRARPEIIAGRAEFERLGLMTTGMHPDYLQSEALRRSVARTGTAFLSQAYPEASPLHPAYGAGHATVAGACVTVLKAIFEASTPITNPITTSADGSTLVPYTGADASSMTVGSELDKLAANVSIGRNAAGIHYRTDHSESVRLGERIALAFLRERKLCYSEPHQFRLTTMDGNTVVI